MDASLRSNTKKLILFSMVRTPDGKTCITYHRRDVGLGAGRSIEFGEVNAKANTSPLYQNLEFIRGSVENFSSQFKIIYYAIHI